MSDVLHLPAEGLDLTDTTVLYALPEHRAGCPIEFAEPQDRAARMEHHAAPLPDRPGEPARNAHVVRCVECGAQAVIGGGPGRDG